MDILANRPNLLFIVAIRRPDYLYRKLLFINTKLRQPLFKVKLLKAITTISTEFDVTRWQIKLDLTDYFRCHREDGPAVIDIGSGKIYRAWYYNGRYHRESLDETGKIGPAIIDEIGNQQWYKHGKLHRIDGPARINIRDNQQEWYLDGKWHRDDGPAITNKWGDEYWFKHGIRHRIDGPAVMKSDALHEWWIDGIRQPEPLGYYEQ